MAHPLMIGIAAFCMSLAAHAGPVGRIKGSALGDQGIVKPLSELLADAGWSQTPELSGVFKVGSVFRVQDDGHGAD